MLAIVLAWVVLLRLRPEAMEVGSRPIRPDSAQEVHVTLVILNSDRNSSKLRVGLRSDHILAIAPSQAPCPTRLAASVPAARKAAPLAPGDVSALIVIETRIRATPHSQPLTPLGLNTTT